MKQRLMARALAFVKPERKRAAEFAEAERPKCTFSNVAANAEARESLETLKDYLLDPEKYARLGARMPRGVLLYGPPGTGKTLMARALAGEAGVPFFALSGSDFVEKYVGVGAMRVRSLFAKARKAGRCVIFIDEIDAMGKRRGDNSSDERDQTLNALLSEMSGFRGGEGVVVLAATNRIETLDAALLRAGRFDRQIEVGLPSRAERLSILRLHADGKPLDGDIDLTQIAAETAYFSGAALENLLNEAAISAASKGLTRIGMAEIRGAYLRATVGSERVGTATPAEKRAIALHETGHALVSRRLLPERRLVRVSILPSGHGAAGYSLSVPEERLMPTKRDLESQICVLLAGRAAEWLTLGEDDLTAGASNDLARAADIAATMTAELGMAGDPAVSVKTVAARCGGDGASALCRDLLNRLFERAKRLLNAEAPALANLAAALIDRETLTGEEVEALLSPTTAENP